MKKLLIAVCMMIGFTGFVSAQQAAPKTVVTKTTEKAVVKKEGTAKVVKMEKSSHVAATGLKADGTPDMRLKENKSKTKTTVVTGPTKKDGSADMRYKKNKKKV